MAKGKAPVKQEAPAKYTPIFTGELARLNPGMPLDMGWVDSVQINKPALNRRAAEYGARRSIKKEHQIAWLCKAITLIDLTTLAGDDTETNTHRLCFKARNPLRSDLLERTGIPSDKMHTAAVCVYPNRVKEVAQTLDGSGVEVASVAAGFPAGQTPMDQRIAEIKAAVADGATEIDIVISREHVISGNWEALYEEIKAFRAACGPAHLKSILAVGELPTFRDIYKASLVAMMAGSDFIKTSTGKEAVNATLPNGLLMTRAAREYRERTGYIAGFKPAGGIRKAKDALAWMAMIYEEVGPEYLQPHLFRFGASALLGDIERQIDHGLTGCYSADRYMPMA